MKIHYCHHLSHQEANLPTSFALHSALLLALPSIPLSIQLSSSMLQISHPTITPLRHHWNPFRIPLPLQAFHLLLSRTNLHLRRRRISSTRSVCSCVFSSRLGSIYRVLVRDNYLAEACGCARRRELGLPFSENDNSSLKCVTKGGYKLKDIYVYNMLHYYFSIDVNMHENHELIRPRLTFLELFKYAQPRTSHGKRWREEKRESVSRAREVSQEDVTLQLPHKIRVMFRCSDMNFYIVKFGVLKVFPKYHIVTYTKWRIVFDAHMYKPRIFNTYLG
ncbi:hypothetical protein LXL04_030165 [Taraxacum kok-saghyz]